MNVIWSGMLETAGRAPSPFSARLVEAPDAALDSIQERGKGLRLERHLVDGHGSRWEPLSVHTVSPVSLAVALAAAARPVVAAREVSGPQPGAGAAADCG